MPPRRKPKGSRNEEESEDEETYVTFGMVRELLITQERLLKDHYQEMFKLTDAKVDRLTTKIDELRTSLEFTQKEVADLKANCAATVEDAVEERIKTTESELKHLKA